MDVARRPVVHQAHAEQVRLGVRDADRLAHDVAGPMNAPTSSS
jgi:hypothetical protein